MIIIYMYSEVEVFLIYSGKVFSLECKFLKVDNGLTAQHGLTHTTTDAHKMLFFFVGSFYVVAESWGT